MDLIEKKRRNSKSYKDRAARRLGPNGIVLQFIEAIEKLQQEATGAIDFDSGLEREAAIFYSRLQAIDPGIDVQVLWNNEDLIEDWKNLRVEGVTITWSKFYLGKNPFSDAQKHIDIGTLFLEGFIEGTSD